MITIKDYVFPENIEKAYDYLSTKKNSVVFGGGAYIRMGSKNIPLGIDLSKAGLNYITENEETINIGAMTTFGDIERSDILNNYFNGILPLSLKDIVGVQFRNIVTVGATVYSRYGFSDIITALLSLDTKVKLYKKGVVTLEEFLSMKRDTVDILEEIVIVKDSRKAVFKSMRNSKGDYAILNMSISKGKDGFKIGVGARPMRGTLAKETMDYLNNNDVNSENIEKACEILSSEITFGSNSRGSSDYRREISKVLLKRLLREVETNEN